MRTRRASWLERLTDQAGSDRARDRRRLAAARSASNGHCRTVVAHRASATPDNAEFEAWLCPTQCAPSHSLPEFKQRCRRARGGSSPRSGVGFDAWRIGAPAQKGRAASIDALIELLRRARLAERYEPLRAFVPKRESDATEAAPERQPTDRTELGMVA